MEEEKVAKTRQRCAVNQRRYRAKLRVINNQRRMDLEEIGRVNERLEGHIAAVLDKRGLWCHAEEQSILEYLRLFQRGYTHSDRQDSFLRYFVTPDVMFNGYRGLEGVVSYWTTRSAMLNFLRVKHVRLTPITRTSGCTIVEMACILEIGMTLQAIRAMFPHALSRPDLVDKILCTPVLLPLHGTYAFDENKQLMWQSCVSNMVEALAHQFGSLNDVVAATSPPFTAKLEDQRPDGWKGPHLS